MMAACVEGDDAGSRAGAKQKECVQGGLSLFRPTTERSSAYRPCAEQARASPRTRLSGEGQEQLSRGRRPWRLWSATTQDSSNGLGAGGHLDPAHGATTHSAFAHVRLEHMSE